MSVRGLFIGINRYGGGNDLAGCVNDARDLAQALNLGSTHRLLLDKQATRETVCDGVRTLVASLRPKDWGVITFSGHGTYVVDLDGDEPDARDEALVCADRELILDDEFASLLSGRHKDARLLVITDCCHSGTVNRLLRPSEPVPGARPRFLPPSSSRARRTRRNTLYRPTLSGVVHFAACRDSEYAFDAVFGERANGAFTRALVDALVKLPKRATIGELFKAVSMRLPSRKYPQHPTKNVGRGLLSERIPRA